MTSEYYNAVPKVFVSPFAGDERKELYTKPKRETYFVNEGIESLNMAPKTNPKRGTNLQSFPSYSKFVKNYANREGVKYKEAQKMDVVKKLYREQAQSTTTFDTLNTKPARPLLLYKSAPNDNLEEVYSDPRMNKSKKSVNVVESAKDAKQNSVNFRIFQTVSNYSKPIARDYYDSLDNAEQKQIVNFKGSINKLEPLEPEMIKKLVGEVNNLNKGILCQSVFPDLVAHLSLENFKGKTERQIYFNSVQSENEFFPYELNIPQSNRLIEQYMPNVKINNPSYEEIDFAYINNGGVFNKNGRDIFNLVQAGISKTKVICFLDSRKLKDLPDFYKSIQKADLQNFISSSNVTTSKDEIDDLVRHLRNRAEENILDANEKLIELTQIKDEPQEDPNIQVAPAVEVSTELKDIQIKIDQIEALIQRDLDAQKAEKRMYFSTETSYKTKLLQEGDLITNKKTLKNITNIYEIIQDQQTLEDKDLFIFEANPDEYTTVKNNSEKLFVVFPAPEDVDTRNIAMVKLERTVTITKEKMDALTKTYEKTGKSLLDIEIERFGKDDDLVQQKEVLLKKKAEIEAQKPVIKGEGFIGGDFKTTLDSFDEYFGLNSIETLGKSGGDFVYKLSFN